MSAADLAKEAVDADLVSARFRAGVIRGQWRQVSYNFPILIVTVATIEPDGKSSEYFFHFELTGFPAALPDVRIRDLATNAPLAPDRRPKGTNRVTKAFQDWEHKTVYRPWDRFGNFTHSRRSRQFRPAYIFRS